jgi:hypothetical protein
MSEAIAAWPDMPRSVLATLLDLSGLPGPMSPRHLLGRPAELTVDQLVELYAADVLSEPKESPDSLTPGFREVADTLRAPRLNITVRIFRPDGACIESNVQFPGPAFDGRGVVLNQIGRYYRLASFADDRALLELVGDAIPPVPPAPSNPFEALLEPVQALTLAGLVDLCAARDGGPITLTEIAAYLSESWGLRGFDALLTSVLVAAGLPAPPARPEVETAVPALAALDLAAPARDGGGFVPGPAAAPVVASRATLTSGLQWQRASEEGGQLVISNRLFLFSESGHALAITRGSKGRVHLASVDRGSVIAFIAHELATSALTRAPRTLKPERMPR